MESLPADKQRPCAQIEHDFKRLGTAYPEYPIPIHERWTALLQVAPWLAKRSLFERFDANYQEAYDSGCPQKVWAASELAFLRWRMLDIMWTKGECLKHVIDYELWGAVFWATKLSERLSDVPAPSAKRTLKRQQANKEKPTYHRWVN